MTIKKYAINALTQLSFLLLMMSVHVQAQTELDSSQNHEHLYQVEIIVFARNQLAPAEHWPSDLRLGYPDNLVSVNSDGSSAAEFSALPANERLLNAQAATLSKGGYTLLYHQAWRQMIYARKTNIAISGGKIFGNHHELEGSIALNVGQYLKIQTNLWLSQFVPIASSLANSAQSWPALPPQPNNLASTNTQTQDYVINRIVKLNQERTMRSNEIHYIDHPLLGIIIKIVPVDTASTTLN